MIFLFLFFEIRKRKRGALKSISIFFVGLNLIVFLLPDTFLYKKMFSKWYYWSEEELKIGHFKGEPIEEMDATAAVYPSIVGKFNRIHNYPSSIIFTTDDNKKSWIKAGLFADKDSISLKSLLRHEKRHLDLTEVYRRRAMDSIKKLEFPTIEDKYLVLEYFYNVSDSINDVFDLETSHGTNKKANKKWDEYLDAQLGYK
ncbi:MAG: hypothetical protein DSY83_16965 [Flavobacteriia bacterium]|nr:MAG: hypothetical protein DSY83_16965 [Flavobacteriia bacterium]